MAGNNDSDETFSAYTVVLVVIVTAWIYYILIIRPGFETANGIVSIILGLVFGLFLSFLIAGFVVTGVVWAIENVFAAGGGRSTTVRVLETLVLGLILLVIQRMLGW